MLKNEQMSLLYFLRWKILTLAEVDKSDLLRSDSLWSSCQRAGVFGSLACMSQDYGCLLEGQLKGLC